MTAGKNHLLRYTRIYAGAYNVSGDTRSIGTLDCSTSAVELWGLPDSMKYSCSDLLLSAGIADVKVLMNDAATKGFAVLKNRPVVVASVLLGSGAEPATGDPAYSMGGAQFVDNSAWEGGAASVAFAFANTKTSAFPWGVVLSPETSRTGTYTGTAIDNGAATTAGWHANLHITASTGGTWAFVLQSSTTGAWAGEETTLGTFSADGSAIVGEYLSGTGTVPQYIRFVATRTSGNVTPVCVFARN